MPNYLCAKYSPDVLEAPLLTKQVVTIRCLRLALVMTIGILSSTLLCLGRGSATHFTVLIVSLCITFVVICLAILIASLYAYFKGFVVTIDKVGVAAGKESWPWNEINELTLRCFVPANELTLSVMLRTTKYLVPRLIVSRAVFNEATIGSAVDAIKSYCEENNVALRIEGE